LVNDALQPTTATQQFTITMTLADGGMLSGVIAGSDGDVENWRIVAALGTMTQAQLLPVPMDAAVATSTDQWNWTVTDVCAQAGILSSRVAGNAQYLFEDSVWVGDGLATFDFANYLDGV
jgi:hypothetical protein